MWSPNELLKTEKQRDILSYITLQFFPFKKVPLEHYPKAGASLRDAPALLTSGGKRRMMATEVKRDVSNLYCGGR